MVKGNEKFCLYKTTIENTLFSCLGCGVLDIIFLQCVVCFLFFFLTTGLNVWES